MSNGERKRQSNIELLRILAIIGVLFLHYNSPDFGKGFINSEAFSLKQFGLIVAETLGICAVNVFVLISGYFMSRSNKRDLLKPAELLFKSIFFGLVFFIVLTGCSVMNRTFDDFLRCFLPEKWFIFVYIALYLLSPYINVLWNNIGRNSGKILIFMSFILFSAYPTVIDELALLSGRAFGGSVPVGASGDQAGMTIVNFVFIYLLGCYLRDRDERKKVAAASGQRKEQTMSADKKLKDNEGGYAFIAYVLASLLIILWTYIDMKARNVHPGESVAFNYNNPLVLTQAVAAFMFFKNVKLPENKVINFIAGGTFTVYIVHTRFIEIINAGSMNIIAATALVYVLCFVTYAVSKILFTPIEKAVAAAWKRDRFIEL